MGGQYCGQGLNQHFPQKQQLIVFAFSNPSLPFKTFENSGDTEGEHDQQEFVREEKLAL